MTAPRHASRNAAAVAALVAVLIGVPAPAQTPSAKPSPWGGAQPIPPGGSAPQAPPGSSAPTGTTSTAPTTPTTPQATAPAPAAPVIARVEGRPITQRDWDRVATPYFAQLRAQLGDRFAEVQTTAKQNVLNELIRQQVVVLEAQKLKIEVSEKETDEVLMRDPFFLTKGAFDAAKFAEFKRSPTSNYGVLLPQV